MWGSNNSKDIINFLLQCKRAYIKSYSKNENIIFPQNSNLVLLVTKGLVKVNRFFDNKQVNIDKLGIGDILFCDFILETDDIIFECAKSSDILFIDYNCMIDNLSNTNYLNLIFKLIMDSNIKLRQRINILSNKTTESKLLLYFKKHSKNSCCVLSISYSDLADYLCVDRSSMMRTLSNMEKCGLINRRGRRIIVLKKEIKISNL